jgi:hypothetical protein
MQRDVADGVQAEDARSRVGNNMIWEEKRSVDNEVNEDTKPQSLCRLFFLCLGFFTAAFLGFFNKSLSQRN